MNVLVLRGRKVGRWYVTVQPTFWVGRWFLGLKCGFYFEAGRYTSGSGPQGEIPGPLERYLMLQLEFGPLQLWLHCEEREL